MIFEDGQIVLFTGDSITDCGRSYPVGKKGSLGSGYVSILESILAARYPQINLQILNTGISGNMVTDLDRRWENDVVNQNPDWLSVMIGINDVWYHFDDERFETVDQELYVKTYRNILSRIREKLKGLIIASPYYIEPDRNDHMRIKMDLYREEARKIAEEFSAIYIDVQDAFDSYLSHRSFDTICDDKVHPDSTGHMIIAESFMAAIDPA